MTLIRMFLTFLAVQLLGTVQVAQAEQVRFTDWFAVDKAALSGWQVKTDAAKHWRVSVVPAAASSPTPYRIHVIYPRVSLAYDIAFSRMLSVFAASKVPAVFEVTNYNRDEQVAREALERARKGGASLIVSMGSDATDWMWSNYRDGELPVVSVCAKDPVLMGQAQGYAAGSGSNFAFTSLNMPIVTQIAHIRSLLPKLENVAILVDAANTSAMRTQAEPLARSLAASGVGGHIVAVEKGETLATDLEREIAGAMDKMRQTDPDLSSSALWITGSTLLFSKMDVIDRAAGKLPILSAVTDIVGDMPGSALMAVGISFESNAHLAALTMLDILKGRTTPEQLPVGIVKHPDIAINFAKARERGLKIPFSMFESATRIHGYEGQVLRSAADAAVN